MRFFAIRAPQPARALLACLVFLGACSVTAPTDPDAARKGISGAPVARVQIIASDGSEAPAAVLLGSSVRLGARTWDASGNEVSNRKVVWSTSTSTSGSINPSGTLATKAVGNVQVIAAVEGVVATLSVQVATQLPAPDQPSAPPNNASPLPPSGPTSPTSIAAAIVRLDGGTGQTIVSTGVPLVPGVLRPGQESFVHVTVDGVEQPAFVTGLRSLHADGSLRAVHVQLRATVAGGQPLAARVEIGTTPRTAANTLAQLGAFISVPSAAILPTSPDYLVSTDLVGPTLTATATAAIGAEYARYDAEFATAADALWTLEGAKWEGNYYDRALVYFAMWVRTANPEYWRRGAMLATTYRHDYLEPNNFGASAHWAQLEGLEKHYLLTGDESSRVAVVRVAEVFTGVLPEYYGPSGGDLRIMARFIQASLLAWRLTPNGDTPVTAQPRDWAARIDFLLGKAAAWQLADGSYPAAVVCNGQMNYMVAMLNDALIRVHTQYRADAALVAQVRRSADQLWGTQWVASAGAFQYLALSCPGVGGLETAPDLNGLFASTYAWLYRRTGDAKYRDAGEQVFANTVRGWYLPGSKQFNQAFTYSFRHLGYR